MPGEPHRYVSRSAEKLIAALDVLEVHVDGFCCADLGCNVGGFTQVLLERGAERVYAVDTGYGALDYSLRKDLRVVVMERTNALHVTLPEACDLATIDVAWTRQKHILPAAARLLKTEGQIITLVKPHYEAPPEWLRKGVLLAERRDEVVEMVRADVRTLGLRVLGAVDSPLAGQSGNLEQLWLVRPE